MGRPRAGTQVRPGQQAALARRRQQAAADGCAHATEDARADAPLLGPRRAGAPKSAPTSRIAEPSPGLRVRPAAATASLAGTPAGRGRPTGASPNTEGPAAPQEDGGGRRGWQGRGVARVAGRHWQTWRPRWGRGSLEKWRGRSLNAKTIMHTTISDSNHVHIN